MGFEILTGIAIASSAAGGAVSAIGKADAANAEAARLERSATYARAKADETDAKMRDELQGTLGMIRAARAAGGIGLDSPGQAAIEDRERTTAYGNIATTRANAEAEAREAEEAARAKRRGAKMALIGGAFDIAGGAAKSAAGMLKS
jgi:hypothetical protein